MTVILFNKPYGVLPQFTDRTAPDETPRPTLADYIRVPQVRPAGRLDRDSEGLLVLTDDGAINAAITQPGRKLSKVYWAQVEGIPDAAALRRLTEGLILNDGPTLPARAVAIDAPAELWPRDPPIRYRAAIPTSWIALTLREGRNRQVRRMTAAVGFPTLRLIRWAVGPWTLADVPGGPGASAVLDLSPGEALRQIREAAKIGKPLKHPDKPNAPPTKPAGRWN